MTKILNDACRSVSLAVVLSIGGFALGQPGGGPPPAKVMLDPVRLERVEQRREVTGEVRAVKRAQLATKEEGLVIEMLVDVGDWVESGAPLARLDARLRQFDADRRKAERDSAEAKIQENEALLEKANRDLRRLEELASREGASKNEVDDASTRVKEEAARLAQSIADLAAARADEATAEKRLADMTIKAPFSGNIVTKRIEVGEWLQEGDAVVEMVAIDDVDAYLDVPERFLAAVSAGSAAVQLRVPAIGRTLDAGEVAVVAEGDRLARTFPVRVRIDNRVGGSGAGLLRPGMSVIGMVPTGEPVEALTVHKDAMMRNDAGAYVFFDAGGMAAVAPVEQQFAVGDRVVVRSPVLKAGMGVITQGNERVFPGQPLAPMGGPPPSAGGPKDSTNDAKNNTQQNDSAPRAANP